MARLTGPACRAGRALLGWTMRDLAREAGVALATVNGIEAGSDYRASTGDKIIAAFAARGVEITNGNGTGARLLLEMDRGEAHAAMEQLVDDLAAGSPPDDWSRRLYVIGLQVGADTLPGRVARAIADITGAPEPRSYRDGVTALEGHLS